MEWARGGGEAAARERRQETTIIHNYEIFTLYNTVYFIIITLIERVLGELIFIYYGILPPDVSSIV
jgi:hypothetical protein